MSGHPFYPIDLVVPIKLLSVTNKLMVTSIFKSIKNNFHDGLEIYARLSLMWQEFKHGGEKSSITSQSTHYWGKINRNKERNILDF